MEILESAKDLGFAKDSSDSRIYKAILKIRKFSSQLQCFLKALFLSYVGCLCKLLLGG